MLGTNKLLRGLEGKPLQAGTEFCLSLEGTMRGVEGEQTGFSRTVWVVASDLESALRWARRIEPAAMREGLRIEESKEVRAVEPGTVEGPYRVTGHIFFMEDR